LKQGGGGLSNPLTTVLFSFLPMLISPTSILPCLPLLFLPPLFLPLSILLPSVPLFSPRLSLAPVSLSSTPCFPYLSAYPLDLFPSLSSFSSLPSSPTSAGPLPPGLALHPPFGRRRQRPHLSTYPHFPRHSVPLCCRQTAFFRAFSAHLCPPHQVYVYLYMSDAQLSESGRVVLPSPHRAGR
jgi:hypothetical protein